MGGPVNDQANAEQQQQMPARLTSSSRAVSRRRDGTPPGRPRVLWRQQDGGDGIISSLPPEREAHPALSRQSPQSKASARTEKSVLAPAAGVGRAQFDHSGSAAADSGATPAEPTPLLSDDLREPTGMTFKQAGTVAKISTKFRHRLQRHPSQPGECFANVAIQQLALKIKKDHHLDRHETAKRHYWRGEEAFERHLSLISHSQAGGLGRVRSLRSSYTNGVTAPGSTPGASNNLPTRTRLVEGEIFELVKDLAICSTKVDFRQQQMFEEMKDIEVASDDDNADEFQGICKDTFKRWWKIKLRALKRDSMKAVDRRFIQADIDGDGLLEEEAAAQIFKRTWKANSWLKRLDLDDGSASNFDEMWSQAWQSMLGMTQVDIIDEEKRVRTAFEDFVRASATDRAFGATNSRNSQSADVESAGHLGIKVKLVKAVLLSLYSPRVVAMMMHRKRAINPQSFKQTLLHEGYTEEELSQVDFVFDAMNSNAKYDAIGYIVAIENVHKQLVRGRLRTSSTAFGHLAGGWNRFDGAVGSRRLAVHAHKNREHSHNHTTKDEEAAMFDTEQQTMKRESRLITCESFIRWWRDSREEQIRVREFREWWQTRVGDDAPSVNIIPEYHTICLSLRSSNLFLDDLSVALYLRISQPEDSDLPYVRVWTLIITLYL